MESALPAVEARPRLAVSLGAAALGVLVGLIAGTLAAEVPEEARFGGWERSADGTVEGPTWRYSLDQTHALQWAAGAAVVAAFLVLAWIKQGRPSMALWLVAAAMAIPPFLLMGPS